MRVKSSHKKSSLREGDWFEDLVKWFYQPTDPSSLGIIRFLFGLLMLLDLPEERGGADIDLRWGEVKDCRFPLFNSLKPLSYPYMSLLYGVMWLGALGIMLGFKFRVSVFLFGVPYWYLLLLDKSYWNNHSYLFGLVTILLAGSSANHYFSIDGIINKSLSNTHVPYWNYFILKFQFFMLYFLAGLKKTDMEWLEGYAMTNLGSHWVFSPFKIVLNTGQIDYFIVHWFGFILDLTVGFWLLYGYTRPIAMIFCSMFHLMNSRMFSIGMFPYVCLATMPLFCEENWPRKICGIFRRNSNTIIIPSKTCIYPPDLNKDRKKEYRLPVKVTWKHRVVVLLLLTHCGLQAFLPYSHFITKGYNNWTNGLYGYSWDMMVHAWDTVLIVVKIVENDTGKEHYIDPSALAQNDRWSKHGDMCWQLARCLKLQLLRDLITMKTMKGDGMVQRKGNHIMTDDISIYIDVWCSLNGRFQQRMYNPNYDLLKAKWSPFKPVEWLLPLLREYGGLRERMVEIQEKVYAWSNYSDVLFIADFPGMYLDNFVSSDLTHVMITVLEGSVVLEFEIEDAKQSVGVQLNKGEKYPLQANSFHRVRTVSKTPACYMYTYINGTKEAMEVEGSANGDRPKHVMKSPFPLIEDLGARLDNFLKMMGHISSSILHLTFNKPLIRRSRFDMIK